MRRLAAVPESSSSGACPARSRQRPPAVAPTPVLRPGRAGSRTPHRARRSAPGSSSARRPGCQPEAPRLDPSSVTVTRTPPARAATATRADRAVECRTTLVKRLGDDPVDRHLDRGRQTRPDADRTSRPTPPAAYRPPAGTASPPAPAARPPARGPPARPAGRGRRPAGGSPRSPRWSGPAAPSSAAPRAARLRILMGSTRSAVSALSTTPVSTGPSPSCRSRRSRRRSSSRLEMIRSRDRPTSAARSVAWTATPIGAASRPAPARRPPRSATPPAAARPPARRPAPRRLGSVRRAGPAARCRTPATSTPSTTIAAQGSRSAEQTASSTPVRPSPRGAATTSSRSPTAASARTGSRRAP